MAPSMQQIACPGIYPHLGWSHSRIPAGSSNELGLGLRVHAGDGLALGVLVDCRAEQEALAWRHAVVPGDKEANSALAAHVPISGGAEGVAPECRGEEVGLAEVRSNLRDIIPQDSIRVSQHIEVNQYESSRKQNVLLRSAVSLWELFTLLSPMRLRPPTMA